VRPSPRPCGAPTEQTGKSKAAGGTPALHSEQGGTKRNGEGGTLAALKTAGGRAGCQWYI